MTFDQCQTQCSLVSCKNVEIGIDQSDNSPIPQVVLSMFMAGQLSLSAEVYWVSLHSGSGREWTTWPQNNSEFGHKAYGYSTLWTHLNPEHITFHHRYVFVSPQCILFIFRSKQRLPKSKPGLKVLTAQAFYPGEDHSWYKTQSLASFVLESNSNACFKPTSVINCSSN